MGSEIPGFDAYGPAIAAIVPVIRDHAAQSDAQRHLVAEVARAMARAGLYRVGVPQNLGGGQAHPLTQIQTIEAVSRVHGSTGWNLMIGIEVMGALASQYPAEVIGPLFEDPELIISGALNPLGRAVRESGGYRISGQWPFASGVHNAAYFWGQSVLYEGGEPVRGDRGPVTLEALMPASEFEILDTWHVSGMRGSGSHDVRVESLFVPDRYISHVQANRPYATGTLYQLPPYSRLAYNKIGVALGIGRAAIECFIELASEKKPRGSSRPLRERPDAQRAVAEAEHILGSARSYAFEQINELWDCVDRGDWPSHKQRALLQLSCSGAANEAVKAVETVYSAAGASANFESSPLERCMRDVLVVRQHIMVSPQYTDAIGRVLMDLESGTFLF
ncbi:MAG: acyl-CoA dehydrogenase family protein [Proteobacteria bacterium]|nr:acyl-CoA dehydrogenase family protein [Pseudomonadota bacterium]